MRALIIVMFMAGIIPCFAQNIFDDEVIEAPKTPETKPVKKPAKGDDEEKPAVKQGKSKKKKKAKKKKKSAASSTTAAGTEYSPTDVARASYAWAPEVDTVSLTTLSPGMQGTTTKASTKPTQVVAAKPEILEEKPAVKSGQAGFKLPQIPLTQVLIVAGFVILFLIYRFRVGRQLKRKRY